MPDHQISAPRGAKCSEIHSRREVWDAGLLTQVHPLSSPPGLRPTIKTCHIVSSRYIELMASPSDSKPTATVADFAEAAECLKMLAHPVRLRIVQLLLHGRYTVGELAADCEVPNNVASEHLRMMQRCRFLASEREGRRVYYRVVEPHLQRLMACIESRFLEQAEP